MVQKILKDEFIQWRDNPITISVFEAVKKLIALTDEELLEPSLIFQPNSEKLIACKVGYKEGLKEILNIDFDEIDKGDNDE